MAVSSSSSCVPQTLDCACGPNRACDVGLVCVVTKMECAVAMPESSDHGSLWSASVSVSGQEFGCYPSMSWIILTSALAFFV